MFDSLDVYEKVMGCGHSNAVMVEYVADDVDKLQFKTLCEFISLAIYHEASLRSIRDCHINTKYRLE